jgi:hypothetical protein
MEIAITKINVAYELRNITIGECSFTMHPERQPDGALLFRLAVVHTSGIPVPLHVNEGWEQVWENHGIDVERAGIPVQSYGH